MTVTNEEVKVPKKRGRKPLQKKVEEPKVPKKRGRKPKGGKIITNTLADKSIISHEINIILHLKCTSYDIKNNNNIEDSVNYYEPSDNYHIINKNIITKESNKEIDVNNENGTKTNTILWNKIKELSINLHTNNIINKKSACFWCTYDFDNPPVYIPKHSLNKTYHCYGCFCSPECATAFLFKEPIDNATRFERYHLLNHLYGKIFNYTNNFKPAPNPYYTLDKYYGNLSIHEFREQIKRDQQIFIVDKPLTRVLPELLEDNNDFILNQHSIPSSSKYVLRKKNKQSKVDIMNENFNLKT